MSSANDRRIRDVRDIWHCNSQSNINDVQTSPTTLQNNTTNNPYQDLDTRTKHKYKTLERHLSMKKTIRKKMMRDLREIGGDSTPNSDATSGGLNGSNNNNNSTSTTTTPSGFLEQIRNDQPPPPNIDKPSLWRRLTKGWGGHS